MKKVFLKKENGSYSVNATSIDMQILGNFLLNNVENSINKFSQFLDDPWKGTYDLCDIYLAKEYNIVKINEEDEFFDEELYNNNTEFFETTIDELHYILDRWEELYKQNPHEIIITRENGTITLESKNS